MSACDYVVLPGLTLPLAAVLLALDLEARGLHMRTEDGEVLIVGPRRLLTDEDRAGLRRWKPHLLAIVTYDAGVHTDDTH
jgi:hypothetical protein